MALPQEFEAIPYTADTFTDNMTQLSETHLPTALVFTVNEAGLLLTYDANNGRANMRRVLLPEATMHAPQPTLEVARYAASVRMGALQPPKEFGDTILKSAAIRHTDPPRAFVPVLIRTQQEGDVTTPSSLRNFKVVWREPQDAMVVLVNDDRQDGINGNMRRGITKFALDKLIQTI